MRRCIAPLSPQEIASALSYLHSRNIIHGDLTGNNVLLSSCTKDLRRFTALVRPLPSARATPPARHKHTLAPPRLP